MLQSIRSITLGLVLAAIVPGAVWAQGCGLLADPNDPKCKAGTGQVPATGAQPGIGGNQAGQEPGMGQQVCAFFDTRTNRCLTLRPNTKQYDSAVQTGIEAAMMGMQIQQDALYRAGQMGILGGFGRNAPGLPSGVGLPPGITLPAGLPQGEGATGQAQSGGERRQADTALVSCTRQRIAQVERAAGRPATPDEVTAAMMVCDK